MFLTDTLLNTFSDFSQAFNFEVNLNFVYLIDNYLSNFNTTLPSLSSSVLDQLANDNYQLSYLNIPNIKLYYPEPFIATPTFSHDDIWFLHITIYQYWLWFFFCFIIVFFFITFLITVRWCNIRHKPVRETRGVSRSKCGDLITATVPVSWAASIIVHESTDAIELADGFGTSELAIGIRAYQWGWEYYYPKDLNLMAKDRSTSMRLGSSLAYWSDLNSLEHSNKFKSFLYNNTPSNTNFNLNYSFVSYQLNDYLLNKTSIENKLISKSSNNLITSPKLFSINQEMIGGKFLNKTLFQNFSMFDFVSGKSRLRRNLFEFTNYDSIYFNNFSKLNHNDLNFLIYNLRTNLGLALDLKFLIFDRTFLSFSNNVSAYFNTFLTQFSMNAYSYDYVIKSNFSNVYGLELNGYVTKLFNSIITSQLFLTSNWFFFYQYSGVDFRRWALAELLEDSLFSDSFETSYFLDNFTTRNLNYFSFSINDVILPSLSIATSGNLAVTSYSTHYIYQYLIDSILQSNNKVFFSKKTLDYVTDTLTCQTLLNFRINFLPVSIFDLSTSFSLKTPDFILSSLGNLFNYSVNRLTDDFRYSPHAVIVGNSIDLISGLKNFSTYYQSFWKVFKTSLEEERSNYNYSLLSQTSVKLPLINDANSVFTARYNKLTMPMYSLSTLKHVYGNQMYQPNLDLNSSWNYFQFEFPFMTAFDSDVIRYIWFDWYSTRGQIITKSLDTSVFNLYGVKDFDYSFINEQELRLSNVTENFYTKFAHARNFYLPSYQYTPLFLNKFFLPKLSNLFVNFGKYPNSVNLLLVNKTIPYSLNFKNFEYNHQLNFNPYNLNNKRITTTTSLLNNPSDAINDLLNIITRRQYLTSKLLNPAINNELNQVNFKFVEYLSDSNLLSNYFTDLAVLKTQGGDGDLSFIVKNQYQPLKKGIHNMIRIQADRAVAMPTDTRLQILAVSKDIIHSWSIPSAGIKIDCIPGYSSHRILMFTLSGIYWGQCMEICGRFHHWMPIVVYFVRRDLFCIWCIHFVFKNQQLNSLYQSSERSNSLLDLKVSSGYNSWYLEL